MTNAGYMFLFLFLTVLFFAIGDFLGVFTKAKLSSVFVAMFLFLVGFMTKVIPADMIQKQDYLNQLLGVHLCLFSIWEL